RVSRGSWDRSARWPTPAPCSRPGPPRRGPVRPRPILTASGCPPRWPRTDWKRRSIRHSRAPTGRSRRSWKSGGWRERFADGDEAGDVLERVLPAGRVGAPADAAAVALGASKRHVVAGGLGPSAGSPLVWG